MSGEISPVKAPFSSKEASCAPRLILLVLIFFNLPKYKNGGQITISVFLMRETDLATQVNNFSASLRDTGFIFQLPIIIFLLILVLYPVVELLSKSHYRVIHYSISFQPFMEYP